MVLQRKATGKEDFHTFKDGFGTLAEPSKMVSRGVQLSSFVGADGDSTVKAYKAGFGTSGDYQGHHCLVHNIQFINTSNSLDPYIEFYDGRAGLSETASGGTERMRIVMGNRGAGPSLVNFNFPIPFYLRNGWAVSSRAGSDLATNAMIINVRFTVLEHKGTTDVEDAEFRFLQSGYKNASGVGTVVSNSDVEVYGAYAMSNSADDYKTAVIEQADGTDIGYHTAIGRHDDEDDIGQSINTQWFPYPLFCEGGFQINNLESSLYTCMFYRKVKSDDNTSNRRQMGL